ncbi:uncharacterized protein LOC109714398 isoform X1 [Ananas comosus]|uniref:Uncharacterized protein LOC109714398 isoform X1 n=1 Tax=Ananas comosus TaxID=4615 RepID=A0A6P5FEA9_ANACO|nr:uncharacterized protein LOC109714398 isoform X1 [Ananas comosus]
MQEWIRRKCEFESLLLGFEFSLIVVKVSHLVSRKGEILLRPASLRKENGYIVLVKIYLVFGGSRSFPTPECELFCLETFRSAGAAEIEVGSKTCSVCYFFATF